MNEVSFLGHKLTGNGIEVDDSKVEGQNGQLCWGRKAYGDSRRFIKLQ